MSGKVEGWDVGETSTAAWAQSPKRTVDMTIDADGVSIEIETRFAGTATAEIPIAVLREVLRRVDAMGAR